ncbi:MAG TPA: hypothetical protein VMX35_10800 [Acidobacteriota bacterium]|nr:hypothetical protein [Acidobacteriota bacterium]
MDREETKKLAMQIKADMPDCKVIGVLRFGENDFALEVHDSQDNDKFTVLNQKDWVVQMLKKKKARGLA